MTKKKALQILRRAAKLLSGVPHKEWITQKFTDSQGKCCAIGHYVRLTSGRKEDYSLYNCYDGFDNRRTGLRSAFEVVTGKNIAEINNSSYRARKGPKGRVMLALKDAIAKAERSI